MIKPAEEKVIFYVNLYRQKHRIQKLLKVPQKKEYLYIIKIYRMEKKILIML